MGMVDFPYRLPNELMEEFGAFTGLHWCGWEIEGPICDAIRAYMKPQPAAQAQPDAVTDAGYQWKQIFLPEGTRLRAPSLGAQNAGSITTIGCPLRSSGSNRQAPCEWKTSQAQKAAQAARRPPSGLFKVAGKPVQRRRLGRGRRLAGPRCRWTGPGSRAAAAPRRPGWARWR